MTRYDRRPRREWDEPARRRTPAQQIGFLRLVGFVAILAGAFLAVRGLGTNDTPPAPTSGAAPRIAVETALAPTMRRRLPTATLTTGTSGELARKLRGGLTVDAAILESSSIAALASSEHCAAPQPIAERGGRAWAACAVNAKGSSGALAGTAIGALTDLAGRDALLGAGFEIPQARPGASAASRAP